MSHQISAFITVEQESLLIPELTKHVEYVGNLIWENTFRQRALERSAHMIGLNKFKIKQWRTFSKQLMRAHSSLARPLGGFAGFCVSEGTWCGHPHLLVSIFIHPPIHWQVCEVHGWVQAWMCSFLSRMRKIKSPSSCAICAEKATRVYSGERLLDSRYVRTRFQKCGWWETKN